MVELDDALELHRNGHLHRAEMAYWRKLSSDPGDAKTSYLLGTLLVQTARYREGMALLLKAMELDSSNAAVYCNLAYAMHDMGRLEEASDCYYRALNLASDNVTLINNLGMLQYDQGDYTTAVTLFSKALAIDPQCYRVHVNLALTYDRINNQEAALASLNNAVALTEGRKAMQLHLGRTFASLGFFERALDVLRAVAESHPHDPVAYAAMGAVTLQCGRNREALNYYRQALALNSTDLELLLGLSSAYEADGQFDEVIAVKGRILDQVYGTRSTQIERSLQSQTPSRSGSSHQRGFMESERGFVLYDIDDPVIGRSLAAYGEYVRSENEFYQTCLNGNTYVVDIGADIGIQTLALAEQVNNEGTVLAFESNRFKFQTLCTNVSLSGYRHVDCRQPKSLEDIKLDALNLTHCDFIRFNCQGHEEVLLKNASHTLMRFKPLIYFVNVLESQQDRIVELLLSAGYLSKPQQHLLFNPNNFLQQSENIFPDLYLNGIFAFPDPEKVVMA